MNTPNDNTAPRGFRGLVAISTANGHAAPHQPGGVPPPPGRFGTAHIVGGSVAIVPAAICLGYGVWGWAAFFLAIAALNLGAGAWYLSILRSTTAQA